MKASLSVSAENLRPFYRLPLCWMGMCMCMTQSDNDGCWGECVTCHRRFGYVDRATLRRYADREATILAAEGEA